MPQQHTEDGDGGSGIDSDRPDQHVEPPAQIGDLAPHASQLAAKVAAQFVQSTAKFTAQFTYVTTQSAQLAFHVAIHVVYRITQSAELIAQITNLFHRRPRIVVGRARRLPDMTAIGACSRSGAAWCPSDV